MQSLKLSKIEDIEAELCGRYVFKDSFGNKQYIDIFFSSSVSGVGIGAKPVCQTSEPDTVIFTLTSSHSEGIESFWQELHASGVSQIVISKTLWYAIQVADEIEVFNCETNKFVSKK